jgi:hypothetical protein
MQPHIEAKTMGKNLQSLLTVVSMTLSMAIFGGCNPTDQLTASEVTSASTKGHTHTVSIPFADQDTTVQVDYTSSSTSGHTHVIALSPQQIRDLNTGMRVVVTSTAALDGHAHLWEIMGGNIIYESKCYYCHSNGQRGAAGMPGKNYTPLASQRAALANPATAPLSTAPAPTPDIASPSLEKRKKG